MVQSCCPPCRTDLAVDLQFTSVTKTGFVFRKRFQVGVPQDVLCRRPSKQFGSPTNPAAWRARAHAQDRAGNRHLRCLETATRRTSVRSFLPDHGGETKPRETVAFSGSAHLFTHLAAKSRRFIRLSLPPDFVLQRALAMATKKLVPTPEVRDDFPNAASPSRARRRPRRSAAVLIRCCWLRYLGPRLTLAHGLPKTRIAARLFESVTRADGFCGRPRIEKEDFHHIFLLC